MVAVFRSRQFLAFLVAGGLAALANFVARILLNQWMPFSWAVLLAYSVGMVTAFLLNRAFVFTDSRQQTRKSIAFFILVNAVAVAQTWVVSIVLARYVLPTLGVERFVLEIAHGIGVVVPVFTSYVGHKRWSFSNRV